MSSQVAFAFVNVPVACPYCGESGGPFINGRCEACAKDPNDVNCHMPLPDDIRRMGLMLQEAFYERNRDRRKPELDDGLTPELRALFVRQGASEG